MGAICLISSQGHHQVLGGLSDAKSILGEKHRFEWLVSSLSAYESIAEEDESGIWGWRSSAMGLINAVAGSGDEVESRCEIRGELRRRGLEHAIEVLVEQEPTQTFLVQVEIYQQESKEDLAELGQLNIRYMTNDSLVAVPEEEGGEEAASSTDPRPDEDEVHLGGLYDEISDLRNQACSICIPSLLVPIISKLRLTSSLPCRRKNWHKFVRMSSTIIDHSIRFDPGWRATTFWSCLVILTPLKERLTPI